jgi:hypothetical protein
MGNVQNDDNYIVIQYFGNPNNLNNDVLAASGNFKIYQGFSIKEIKFQINKIML